MESGKKFDEMTPEEIDDLCERLDEYQSRWEEEHPNVGYHRFVEIKLPPDARFEFNVGDLRVPCRDILTWAAQACPEEAPKLIGIRDQFYAGDEEDDHEFGFDGADPNVPTPEQLAIKRVERARLAAQREAKAREIIEAEARNVASAAESGAFFEPARRAVAPERLALRNKHKELDAAWDEFVIQREAWTPEQRKQLEETARARLEAREAELFEESLDIERRYEALLDEAFKDEEAEKSKRIA
ncbi:hypothetical protein L2449_09435 [Mesorhizobium muleiense]|uniref:hypothetical protein n=1 Tax=Mesorhizobium muleiense TaxID=1004279 RepID=UPI001F247A16|nr:hypothetical protein [Mesorhizobium muleiense]MCF6117135.1 hypothetical protein [Mesorhizobium muleiense]